VAVPPTVKERMIQQPGMKCGSLAACQTRARGMEAWDETGHVELAGGEGSLSVSREVGAVPLTTTVEQYYLLPWVQRQAAHRHTSGDSSGT
jgi:hypothetical protein